LVINILLKISLLV